MKKKPLKLQEKKRHTKLDLSKLLKLVLKKTRTIDSWNNETRGDKAKLTCFRKCLLISKEKDGFQAL